MPNHSNVSDQSSLGYQDALLLSDDLSAVNGIREFLVTHGCRVFTESRHLEKRYISCHSWKYNFCEIFSCTYQLFELKILLLLVEGSNDEVASFSPIFLMCTLWFAFPMLLTVEV